MASLVKTSVEFSLLTHQDISCCACFVSHAVKEENMEIKWNYFFNGRNGGNTCIYGIQKCAHKVNQLVHVDGISRTDKCMLFFGVKRLILLFTLILHLENTGTAKYDMNIIAARGSISRSNPQHAQYHSIVMQ